MTNESMLSTEKKRFENNGRQAKSEFCVLDWCKLLLTFHQLFPLLTFQLQVIIKQLNHSSVVMKYNSTIIFRLFDSYVVPHIRV